MFETMQLFCVKQEWIEALALCILLTEPGFGSVSNFQLCCDVLRFFGFLYCCCKYVTSMIICASGFYTVVCDHSSWFAFICKSERREVEKKSELILVL